MKFFKFSEAYTEAYPGVAFGLTLIKNCTNASNPPSFDQHKRKLLRKMRRRETLAEIDERIGTYDQFFQSFGYQCPLPKHLKRTIHSGFPRYNLMVDTHFMAEMCAGILVAVTDFDRIDGILTLDLAQEGEICHGMGGQKMTLKKGEIVLRDTSDVVCVLCQGGDEKTRVNAETRNVLFYAYAVPGIEPTDIHRGLTIAADTMQQFGNGTIEFVETLKP